MIDEITLGTIVYTMVEIFKMSGLPSKFAPLLSVLMGVGFALLSGLGWATGLFAGLAASGLYAGAKASMK